MVVHHRHDIGPRAIDLAVDEALADRGHARFYSLAVERLAVEVVLEDVFHLHGLGRDGAGEEETLRILRRAQADVAVGVDHAVLGEDAVGGDQVFEQRRFHLSGSL
jgi:hypothetical protein